MTEPTIPAATDVLFALVKGASTGQFQIVCNISPSQALRLLASVMEDVRDMAAEEKRRAAGEQARIVPPGSLGAALMNGKARG